MRENIKRLVLGAALTVATVGTAEVAAQERVHEKLNLWEMHCLTFPEDERGAVKVFGLKHDLFAYPLFCETYRPGRVWFKIYDNDQMVNEYRAIGQAVTDNKAEGDKKFAEISSELADLRQVVLNHTDEVIKILLASDELKQLIDQQIAAQKR